MEKMFFWFFWFFWFFYRVVDCWGESPSKTPKNPFWGVF